MMLIFVLCGVARQKRFVQGDPVQRERECGRGGGRQEEGWNDSLHCNGGDQGRRWEQKYQTTKDIS